MNKQVTIMVTSCNTIKWIKICIQNVTLMSTNYDFIVFDNNSNDGTIEYIKKYKNIKLIENKKNIGHGSAMQQMANLVETPFMISLDSDAFPIQKDWIDVLLQPMLDDNKVKAVSQFKHREYAHPYCAIFEVDTFKKIKTTFEHNYGNGKDLGNTHWDVAEKISIDLLKNNYKIAILNKKICQHAWCGTIGLLHGKYMNYTRQEYVNYMNECYEKYYNTELEKEI